MESSKEYYEVLKDSLYVFSKYIVAEDFLDLLIKDNVLSLDDKELICNQFINQTRRQRATKLVEIIMLRGEYGFDRFMEYLEYLYPHVFTMVTNKKPRLPPPHLKRNRESDKLRLINELPNLAQQIKDQWHVNKELDTELTVLQHILEYAKEENTALEKEIESLKETRFENDNLKLQIANLEKKMNEQQVLMNKEMLRTFDYITQRDELQEKLRENQVKCDELYKQLREHTDMSAGKEAGASKPAVKTKPPDPDKNRPDEQKILQHMVVAEKILKDELHDYREKCEELSEELQKKSREIEILEDNAIEMKKELNKLFKENKTLQKHLSDTKVKRDSYFEIIQKKDRELLENQNQKMREELRLQEVTQTKNELFQKNHRLESEVKELQCELDRIKARQSSSSVDIDNSASCNSGSEDEDVSSERRFNLKKKASREGRYSSRHAVFGGDHGEDFTNIEALVQEVGEDIEDDIANVPDYYKASTLPPAVNETPEMVFRRECAMFRYTTKHRGKGKEKVDYASSMNVEPSGSIKNPNRMEEPINPAALTIRSDRQAIEDKGDSSVSSINSSLLAREPTNGAVGNHPVAPPKPPHLLNKDFKERKRLRRLPKSNTQSEDFPCWEVSTQYLPKDCVRVNRPGLPDKHMCREVTLKYPIIDDKISIKGGNHTGIYIHKVLKPGNISEGEEIKGIVYVPSQRNEEATTSLDGCTLEETHKLFSAEYISWKKEKEVKLKVKNCHQEYDSACQWMKRNAQTGDYIFVRCNMDVTPKTQDEVKLKQGDIYLITNTQVEPNKWLGKKINQTTGELDTQEVILPNCQQANLRRFPSATDNRVPLGTKSRRDVVKIRGQCYDRVLPMTASLKLPVYIMGAERIVQAVIDLITTDSMFIRKENDAASKVGEPMMHDAHYVTTGGILDHKSQSKAYSRIYLFINVTAPFSEEASKDLFGENFQVDSDEDPVAKSTRIKQHLLSTSLSHDEIELTSNMSKTQLMSQIKQLVEGSQKKLIWLNSEEMDESVAKKYTKYLGQDLGQLLHKVSRANSLDQQN